jgi:hypothetical protein
MRIDFTDKSPMQMFPREAGITLSRRVEGAAGYHLKGILYGVW